MGEPVRKSAAPVAKAKACLACRSKHIRCDGADPCSNCAERTMSCVYVASRRGFYARRPQHQNQQQHPHYLHQEPSERAASAPTATSASTTPAEPAIVTGPPSSPSSASDTPSSSSPTLPSFEAYANALASTNTNITATAPRHHLHPPPAAFWSSSSSSDAALDAYYHYCFPAHPFVLPRAHFSHHKVASAPAGHALLAAMRWAGSLFVRAASPAAREGLFAKARDAVAHELTPRNGYLAQAMLVMVIAMDGVCDRVASAELLGRLEALALEIGLHRREFAAAENDAVSAESLRRTWWELYVVDAMVAGVHRKTSFPLHGVESDVGLPCEEDAYLKGDIPTSPPPRLLSQLQDEAFSADDGYEFSSFAYRVQCASAMGQFTTTTASTQCRQQQYDGGEWLRRAEATLTNWKLHLPERKRAALGRGGQHDEMMFQALMMHHAMSIMLHQPLSHLDTSAAEPIDACAAPEHTRSQAQASPALLMISPSSSSSPYSPPSFVPSSHAACDAHAARAVAAATAISDLVTHREAMLRHSHFFACVVTLSSVVHFSRWALATEFFAQPAATCAADDDVRQCIKLNIGALRALAQVWPAASNACLQVQSVARELHNLSSRVASAALLPGDTLEVNLAQALAVDDTLWQMWNSLG